MASAVTRRSGCSSSSRIVRADEVEGALEESVGTGVLRLAQVKHRHARDVVEVQAGRRHVEHVGGDHQLDPGALELPREVTQRLVPEVLGVGHHHRRRARDAREPRRSRGWPTSPGCLRRNRPGWRQRLAVRSGTHTPPTAYPAVGCLSNQRGELGSGPRAADDQHLRRRLAPQSARGAGRHERACARPAGRRGPAGTPSRGRSATRRSAARPRRMAMIANTRNVATMTRRYSSRPVTDDQRTPRLVDLERQPTTRQPGPVRARRRTRRDRRPGGAAASRIEPPEPSRARAPGRRGRRRAAHGRVVDATRPLRRPRRPQRPGSTDATPRPRQGHLRHTTHY